MLRRPLRNEDLERAIAEAPDDLAQRAVYSDWLLERGELHGALIALQLRRHGVSAEAPAVADLIEESRLMRAVFDELKAHPLPILGYTVRLGFLDELTLGGGGKNAGAVLRAILAHRTAPFLRALEILTAPRPGARWTRSSREDRDEKATVMSVWSAIREVGLPRTLRVATLPAPTDDGAAGIRALARVEELTWPLRGAALLEQNRAELTALRSLTLRTVDIAPVHGSRVQALVDALADAPSLAALPELTIASHATLQAAELAELAEHHPHVRVVFL